MTFTVDWFTGYIPAWESDDFIREVVKWSLANDHWLY